MIGDHLVTLLPLGGDPVDITCLVDQVAIHHGRDDPDSQPEASSATLDLAPPFETDAMPGLLEIGASILVETGTVSGVFTRFRGRVTDISYGWEEAGEDTPNRLQGQVIAVGPLADLGRRIVGDTPWAQQLDGARVAAVLAAAGVVLDPLYSDPGTVQILARDVDSQPALEVAQGTAESANGLVWETREGEVRYADADHRRGIPAALELDACDVLVTPTWKRSTEALLNRVSLGYGPVPAEGEQARYVADRPDSVARYGRYELSTETELATLADATALGELLLTRNASPVWVMAELPVDMKGLDAGQTDALLGMDMHSLVALTGLPSAGAAPTTTQLWLEGWSETLRWGEHEITLAVTGYCRTVPAPRWNDVDPAWTWDNRVPAPTAPVVNGIANPSAEVNTSAWLPGGSTLSQVADPWPAETPGAQVLRVTTATVTSNDRYAAAGVATSGMTNGMQAGKTYTFAAWLRAPVALTGTLHVFSRRLAVFWKGPSTNNAYVSKSSAAAPNGNAVGARLSLTFTLPADCTDVLIRAYCGSQVIGEYVDVDSATLTEGPDTPAYFDGSTPDTLADEYAWTGADHVSTSVHTAYVPNAGIPDWDSLTWDDMTCLGPPQNYGRWDDTPASTRWDLVPAATTWDTWK